MWVVAVLMSKAMMAEDWALPGACLLDAFRAIEGDLADVSGG
jgi:hypothetical protein